MAGHSLCLHCQDVIAKLPTWFEAGTLSHGTMRTQDLIPAFMAELDRIKEAKTFEPGADDPEAVREIGRLDGILGDIESRSAWMATGDDSHPYWSDEASYLDLGILFDVLDELAPEGFCFGAHEGDGSDYGFWEVEDDKDERATTRDDERR